MMVAPRAETLDSALEALRWADRVCTLVSVQAPRVKRSSFLKVGGLCDLRPWGGPRLRRLRGRNNPNLRLATTTRTRIEDGVSRSRNHSSETKKNYVANPLFV